MESCDNCKQYSDELFQCKSCATIFCNNCGNIKKPLCQDCDEFEETNAVDGLKDLEG